MNLFLHILFYSCVKMVNQLLAGVHIASAAEAMAFGARLGLNTRMLFEVITNSGGTSWYVSYTLQFISYPLFIITIILETNNLIG